MTEKEYEFSSVEKIKMAKEFTDTPFWRKVFQPHFKDKIMECMSAFVNCKKEDLDRLQAAVGVYNALDDFVDEYIESAEIQIEMDKQAAKIEQARELNGNE